jgi:hypothetical protein
MADAYQALQESDFIYEEKKARHGERARGILFQIISWNCLHKGRYDGRRGKGMIKGVTFWNDREYYFAQPNNPTEEVLRKRSDQERLVSCGPTAAANCAAAMGFRGRGVWHRLGQHVDPCYISTLILAISTC